MRLHQDILSLKVTSADEWFGDEHGRIYFPELCMKPALGGRIELSASHCDPTINLFDSMWIIKADIVIDCWKIDLRGCCR